MKCLRDITGQPDKWTEICFLSSELMKGKRRRTYFNLYHRFLSLTKNLNVMLTDLREESLISPLWAPSASKQWTVIHWLSGRSLWTQNTFANVNLFTHNLYLRYFCFRLNKSEGGLFPPSLEGGVLTVAELVSHFLCRLWAETCRSCWFAGSKSIKSLYMCIR